MLKLFSVIAIIGGVTAVMSGVSCERGPTTTYIRGETTGHVTVEFFRHSDRGSYSVSNDVRDPNPEVGDVLRFLVPGNSSPNEELRPTTTIFTVEQAGLTTFTMTEWERETSSGLTADSWLRKQSFFAISAPVGAQIEVPFSHDTDPLDVQLKIDYDADGIVDAELSPDVAAEGENLEGSRPKVEPVVEENGQQGQALVSFNPAVGSPDPAIIYYAIYPSQPQLQVYTEPILVDEGSYILYGAAGETGTRQQTGELSVLGGIAEDVQLSASINGEPLTVATIVPGQRAAITFAGEQGQQVKIEFGPMTGGVQSDNQATLDIIGPDGERLRELGILGAEGLGVDPWSYVLQIPSDGIYTIVIDPRLANIITTTVSLSQMQ